MHDLEGGDDVGHLRHPQQPTQPDDLDRHTDSRQRVVHICGCRVVAHQHADVAPARGRHGPVCTRNRIGQEPKLVLVGLEHSRPNPAGKGFCLRLERLHSSVAGVQLRGQLVSGLQDLSVGTPVDAEREA